MKMVCMIAFFFKEMEKLVPWPLKSLQLMIRFGVEHRLFNLEEVTALQT